MPEDSWIQDYGAMIWVDNYINISTHARRAQEHQGRWSTLRGVHFEISQRFRINRDQTIQSWSQTLPRSWRKIDQEYQKVSQSRLSRLHRLRKSSCELTQGCIVHSRSPSNQYFNFHYMFGGFKRWVVDRYLVGSLYRNGFRVMWFPGLLYFVCIYFLIQSVAITCASMTTLLTTSSTFQIDVMA